jgi:DNA repair protein RadC
LANPNAVRDYFRLKLGDRPHEVFAVALVDVRVLNHLIVTRSKVLNFAEEGLL